MFPTRGSVKETKKEKEELLPLPKLSSPEITPPPVDAVVSFEIRLLFQTSELLGTLKTYLCTLAVGYASEKILPQMVKCKKIRWGVVRGSTDDVTSLEVLAVREILEEAQAGFDGLRSETVHFEELGVGVEVEVTNDGLALQEERKNSTQLPTLTCALQCMQLQLTTVDIGI